MDGCNIDEKNIPKGAVVIFYFAYYLGDRESLLYLLMQKNLSYLSLFWFGIEYAEFGRQLNLTRRPILYSCEWANNVARPNFTAISAVCNMERIYNDINVRRFSKLNCPNFCSVCP